jgi:hypothetical protein
MKILIVLLLAFTVGLPLNGRAADLVVGSVTCTEWLSDRAAKTDYMNKNVDESWVMGFLSAYSATARVPFMEGIKPAAIYSWMDKYCKNHPKNTIDDGALHLAHLMMAKAQK